MKLSLFPSFLPLLKFPHTASYTIQFVVIMELKKKKKEKDTYNDVIKARTRKNIDFYIFRHRDLLNNFK